MCVVCISAWVGEDDGMFPLQSIEDVGSEIPILVYWGRAEEKRIHFSIIDNCATMNQPVVFT